MQIPSDLPVRFYSNANLTIDENGQPFFVQMPGPQVAEGPITLAIRDHIMIHHYFHWIEVFLGLFFAHQEFGPERSAVRLLVGRQPWNNSRQNFVQSKILRCIYGDIEVVSGDDLAGTTLQNILCVDRSLAKPQPHQTVFLNKFHNLIVAVAHPVELDFDTALIVRNPPRTFVPAVADKLLNIIGGGAIDYSDMPWEGQIGHSSRMRLQYGVHGNGLTNAIWMKPGSTLFEFFPPAAHHYDYQVLAELFGLRYFGFQGKNVWREFSRYGSAHGHSPEEVHVAIEEVNWQAVITAIEDSNCRQTR